MMTKSNVRILEAVTLALIWMEGRMMAKLMEQIMAKCIVIIIAQKCMARNIARIKILALGKNYVARLQQLAHFHNLQNLARIAASGFAKEIWQNYKFSPVDEKSHSTPNRD